MLAGTGGEACDEDKIDSLKWHRKVAESRLVERLGRSVLAFA